MAARFGISVPPDIVPLLDGICDRFAAAWSQGASPVLGDYLAEADVNYRSTLLEELVAIELAARRERGEEPRLEDYAQQYPELEGMLAAESLLTAGGEPPTRADTHKGVSPSSYGKTHVDNPELPGYEIIRELGRGGMGVVYLGRHVGLKRLVAIKMIIAGPAASDDSVSRFRTEAESVARLQHPNIVQVYDIGVYRGLPFFTLEFVDGGPLSKALAGEPLPPSDAAALTRQLALAMHVAHDAGIIHRDLKPGNILIVKRAEKSADKSTVKGDDRASADLKPSKEGKLSSSTQLKITDFGLAKQLDSQNEYTASGDVLGTPSYMSPEQAEGNISKVGRHADTYALGAILYEMLTGRPPFRAPTILATLDLVRSLDPVAPQKLQPGIPRDLETICLKCLRKVPTQRYESSAELAADLGRFLEGVPIRARRASIAEVAMRWCIRKPALASLLTLGLFMVTVVLPLLLAYRVRLNEVSLKAENETIRAGAAEQLAGTQQYYSLVNAVRSRNTNRPLGWMQENLADLKKAVALDTKSKNLGELRTLTIDCLGGIDLREVRTFDNGSDNSLVAISPDGKTLATCPLLAAFRCSIKLFDIDSGALVKELAFPADPLYHLKHSRPNGPRELIYSPDGKYLFAGARNGKLHCWNIGDSFTETSWIAHPDARIEALAVSPDSTIVYSTGGNSVKAWTIGEIDKPLAEYKDAVDTPPFGIFVDPIDGKWVGVVGDKSQVNKFLDPKTLSLIGEPSAKTTIGYRGNAEVSRCGRILVHTDMEAALIRGVLPHGRARNLAALGMDSAHKMNIDCMKLSPDGSLCVTGSGGDDDRCIKLWEFASGKLLATCNLAGVGNEIHIAFCPDARRFAVCGNRKVVLFEIVGQFEATFAAPQPHAILAARFCGDSETLALFVGDRFSSAPVRDIVRWDSKTGTAISCATSPYLKPSAFSVASDNAKIVGHARGNEYLVLNDKSANSKTVRGRECERVEFHPSGASLWAIEARNLWGMSSDDGKELFKWQGPPDPTAGRSTLTSIVVGRTQLVVGARNGNLTAMETGNPAPRLLAPVHSAPVNALALDPDESHLAVGYADAVLTIRDLVEGKVVGELKGHSGGISALAFGKTKEAEYLASGARDKTVRLWMKKENRHSLVATITFDRDVKSVEFDPSGTKLMVLLENEFAVRVWHIDRLRQTLSGLGLDW